MDIKAFGLQNFGAVCYFNSLIQALLSCTFVESDNEFVISLKKLSKCTDSVTNCAHLLKFIIKDFPVGSQHCSLNAFDCLVNIFDKKTKDLFEVRQKNIILCTKCKHQTDNVVQNYTFNLFHTDANVSDSILHHKSLGYDYTCDKCKIKNKSILNYILTFAPVNFVLYVKPGSKVIVDKEFKILGKNHSSLDYKFVAGIYHVGSYNSGHYWSIVKRGEKLYTINDESVTEYKNDEITGNNIYMIFYVRKQ